MKVSYLKFSYFYTYDMFVANFSNNTVETVVMLYYNHVQYSPSLEARFLKSSIAIVIATCLSVCHLLMYDSYIS